MLLARNDCFWNDSFAIKRVYVYREAGTVERSQDMEVRLDAKVTNEAETRALGIEVGDFVFDPRFIAHTNRIH